MKRITLLKKALCLSTLALTSLCLAACSKNVLGDKDYLKSVGEFRAQSNGASKATEFSLAGREGTTVEYPFIYNYDDDNRYVYSMLKDNEQIYSGKKSTTTTTTMSTGLFIGNSTVKYLKVTDTTSTLPSYAIYDCLGNEVLPMKAYENVSISLTRYKTKRTGEKTYDYLCNEAITYTYDKKKEIVKNEVKFSFSNDTTAKEVIKALTRTPLDSDYVFGEYKEGDFFLSGSSIDLELYGMKGYRMLYNKYVASVYNSKNELVSSFEFYPSIDSTIPKYAFMDGYMICQYSTRLPYDAEEYDYYLSGNKYNLVTFYINLKNGKRKDLPKFKYIFNSEIGIFQYDVKEKGEYHKEVYSLYVSSIQEIVNKNAILSNDSLFINAKGKILQKSSAIVSPIGKLDDKHYLASNMSRTSYWMLNKKGERTTYLGTVQPLFDITSKTLCIIDDLGYRAFTNYDGKLITDFKYVNVSKLYESCFYATDINGKKYIITLGDQSIASITELEDTTRSTASSINNTKNCDILFGGILVKTTTSGDNQTLVISTPTGDELINTNCYSYSINQVSTNNGIIYAVYTASSSTSGYDGLYFIE